MKTKVLQISELHASGHPVVYTCHGLGSCVGLFITDRTKGISGGAHIPLPSMLTHGTFLDATSMINRLLHLLAELGSDLDCLRAKIAGGANIFRGAQPIGEANSKVVLAHLVNHKIYIAAKDIGGTISRTARYNSITGELTISTSEQKTYRI